MTCEEIIARYQDNPGWLNCHRAAVDIQKCRQDNTWQPDTEIRMAFLASFTLQPLVDFAVLQAAVQDVAVLPYVAPYGQVAQQVIDPASPLYAFEPEMVFLAVEYDTLSQHPQQAAEQLIGFAETLKTHSQAAAVITTFPENPRWPFHLMRSEVETEIAAANDWLRQTCDADPRLQLCELDRLAAYYGYERAFSAEMAAMAKIPFSEGFLKLLGQKIFSHISDYKALARKCLVLDCDNTLWGGVIGEDGIDGIVLGPDWPGREFVEFQKAILELYHQGVILAINSKNNLSDVMEVLKDHPHMQLREEHFAAIAANWQPKPENMKTIAHDINIGMDSLVFVDDNPAERTMMKQMCPQIATLDLPGNPSLYAETLRRTNYFAKSSLTVEDKKRGQIYAAQRRRKTLQDALPTLDEYLKSLEMVCTIRLADEKDVRRIAQLTQRTNQFNLTTRRYSQAQIQQMLNSEDWKIYILGLKDRFGDNGTVGLALVKTRADQWCIDTFLMSCRVIGRQAEEALLDRIRRDARADKAARLTAQYIQSPKNNLVADFWDKMQFKQTNRQADSTDYECDLGGYVPQTFGYLKIQ